MEHSGDLGAEGVAAIKLARRAAQLALCAFHPSSPLSFRQTHASSIGLFQKILDTMTVVRYNTGKVIHNAN
jgi:hypothetical protein